MILTPFSAVLSGTLAADDTTLPLNDVDNTRLYKYIPEGEQAYLTISNCQTVEYVLATNNGGTITIERAQGGTTASKFPCGSCVFFEVSPPSSHI